MRTSLRPNRFSGQAGFTLIEVLIAVAILTIGILAVNAMQIAAISGNSSAHHTTESTSWAADRVETLLTLNYDDSALNDDDGDGTIQDGDGDGVDDDDGNGVNTDVDNNDIDDDDNFGLDHMSPAMADGTDASPDGIYTIFWNVAVDSPFPGIKTIKVIITRQEMGQIRTTAMVYMKADSV
ncbi:MAG: prepilin-type N-terminal cleavage/methylation domain-containing protein [Deltaproteobacteria bacterium]|nr:prepilin-type N-terminal cleavage/methylation domain-containing protein [Deltaproteobacteria bacterium]